MIRISSNILPEGLVHDRCGAQKFVDAPGDLLLGLGQAFGELESRRLRSSCSSSRSRAKARRFCSSGETPPPPRIPCSQARPGLATKPRLAAGPPVRKTGSLWLPQNGQARSTSVRIRDSHTKPGLGLAQGQNELILQGAVSSEGPGAATGGGVCPTIVPAGYRSGTTRRGRPPRCAPFRPRPQRPPGPVSPTVFLFWRKNPYSCPLRASRKEGRPLKITVAFEPAALYLFGPVEATGLRCGRGHPVCATRRTRRRACDLRTWCGTCRFWRGG